MRLSLVASLLLSSLMISPPASAQQPLQHDPQAVAVLQGSHQTDRNAELTDRLLKIAYREFGSTPVTPEAADALRSFVEKGASRLKRGDEQKAEANIKTFADDMLKNASFDERIGKKQIDLNAFKLARASICPLYPFC